MNFLNIMRKLSYKALPTIYTVKMRSSRSLFMYFLRQYIPPSCLESVSVRPDLHLIADSKLNCIIAVLLEAQDTEFSELE